MIYSFRTERARRIPCTEKKIRQKLVHKQPKILRKTLKICRASLVEKYNCGVFVKYIVIREVFSQLIEGELSQAEGELTRPRGRAVLSWGASCPLMGGELSEGAKRPVGELSAIR